MTASFNDLMKIDSQVVDVITLLQSTLQAANKATDTHNPTDVFGDPMQNPTDGSPAPSYAYALGVTEQSIRHAIERLENVRSTVANSVAY